MLFADEVGGVIGAAASLVCGHLWKSAQRTCSIDVTLRHMRRGDLFRRLSFFNPLVQNTNLIPGIRAIPAAAVIHARNHEQAVGRVCFLWPDSVDHSIVIIDTA